MIKESKSFILITAFLSGMSIMAMEISSSRLLAPYFGASIFVWTNIIGIVMLALSVGYYFGGRIADKYPKINILLSMIFFSGIIFFTIPFIVNQIASMVTARALILESGSFVIFIGSFLVTLLLFGVPLTILGMTSPFLIKIYSLKNKNIGETSGNIFAVSTLGSLVGTFTPTLILIPTIGTKATIITFAIIQIFWGSLGFFNKKTFILLTAVAMAPLFVAQAAFFNFSDRAYFSDESAYQYIEVLKYGNDHYLSYNEGLGIQSYYNPDKYFSGMYYDYYSLLPHLYENDTNVLIIGLAGGTIARQLDYYHGNKVSITGVEIDKKITDIAKNMFELNDQKIKIVNQDGRIFIRETNEKFDIIIVDAYSNEMYIPWTLVTQEFWKEISSRLTDDGVVAINVNSPSDNSSLISTIKNTLASVYNYNFIMGPLSDNSSNYLLFSSNSNTSSEKFNLVDIHPDLKNIASELDDIREYTYSDSIKVFTDDWSPVEFMTDKMIFDHIF